MSQKIPPVIDTGKMMRAEVSAPVLKRFYKLRPALGHPSKAIFTTAAVRFATELAEARRIRMENGAFVETKK